MISVCPQSHCCCGMLGHRLLAERRPRSADLGHPKILVWRPLYTGDPLFIAAPLYPAPPLWARRSQCVAR